MVRFTKQGADLDYGSLILMLSSIVGAATEEEHHARKCPEFNPIIVV